MKKWLLLLLVPALLMDCKGKKKNLPDEEFINVDDFITLFRETKLPLQMADSSFHKKENDSLAVPYLVFTHFVPDTLLTKYFGKSIKPKIYPVVRISVKKQETYLFLKAISPTKKIAFILVFDMDMKFVTGMPLLIADKDEATLQTAGMDSKYTITTNVQRKTSRGLVYKKAAYVFNSAGVFTLILTESNDMTAVKNVLLNPIDTFPRKNKLAGDYFQNKLNLVSIRDSKNSNEVLFFVHFEKEGGTCKGELKGEARWKAPNKMVYRRPGDQCVLEFNFSGSKVTLKEEEGCGSHRDIKCFFEGSYFKKPTPKAGKPSKKR